MAKGSVRKKGKKWYYRFYVEDASGNLIQKEYVGTESKTETEKLLRQAMDDYEKKKFVAKGFYSKKNIANLIYLREDMRETLKGRYVLLFDDIVTTGASMSVCVSVLRRAGVRGVVCLTLASDAKKEISASR